MNDERVAGHTRLNQFIEDNHEALLRQLRVYVLTWNLASGDDVTPMSERLLSDVVFQALKSADRFDVSRAPMAWLLGIAVNMVKRELAERGRLSHRERPVRDLYPGTQAEMSTEEIFDRYFPRTTEDSSRRLESEEEWEELVAGVSETDREILRLKYHNGLKDRMIATILNITPAAVRKRQQRARERLRKAKTEQQRVDRK